MKKKGAGRYETDKMQYPLRIYASVRHDAQNPWEVLQVITIIKYESKLIENHLRLFVDNHGKKSSDVFLKALWLIQHTR